MQDYYHIHFREYHEKTFSINPDRFLSVFVKMLLPSSRILDVGCGSGRDILWLMKKGFSVTGFEKSPGLASLARKNSGCEIIENDFETYDFSTLSVKAVLMSGALVHLPPKRFNNTFKNITSAVKEEGIVYISLKEGRGSKCDTMGRTFYLWQEDDLKKIFNTSGFSILSVSRSRSAAETDEIWLGFVLSTINSSRICCIEIL
jgi:SAM-dependent methyltransferase